MKVLHLNTGNETGGGMIHILTLLKQLKNSIDVTLGVFYDGELAKRARNLGINVHVFKQKSRLDIKIIREIKHFINKNEIDILHSHGPRANFIASLIKPKNNYEWLITVHSNPKHDFLNQGIIGKIFTYLNLHAVKSADQIIAISERFKQELIKNGVSKNKIHVILNGIDFSVIPKKAYKREEFGLSKEDFVILMIARLEPVKSHETALMALNKLVKNNKKIHLLIVGDGSRRRELESYVRKERLDQHVTFLGHREDVVELFTLCDISILTSKSESFPLVLLESARAKKTVITTDVGGVQKLIPNEKYGYIIDIGDHHDLAVKISKMMLLKNSGELEQMGERLFHHASKSFSEKKFGESILEIYSTVLKNK